MIHLILASRSPRRRELLASFGIPFTVRTAAVEELKSLPEARKLPELNAVLKADAVAELEPDALVIGADTLIVLGRQVIGKPESPEEAREILRRLSGRTHEVITGVALRRLRENIDERFSAVTRVRFRKLTTEAIRHYLEQVDVLDKAGAYAIQEHGEMLVESIDGALDNVIGLPCAPLRERLTACGMLPGAPRP